jgi:hypothetical protein
MVVAEVVGLEMIMLEMVALQEVVLVLVVELATLREIMLVLQQESEQVAVVAQVALMLMVEHHCLALLVLEVK